MARHLAMWYGKSVSSDLRFWLARFAVFAGIGFEIFLVAKIKDAGFSEQHTQLKVWAIIFAVAIPINLAITVYYYFSKASRWQSSVKDRDQVAVETISKLGSEKTKNIRFR